ncbi:unnamed protein product, partial [Porites lobata]
MTCASESISSMAEKELLSDEVKADIFFVIVPAIALISRNVTLKVYGKQRKRLFTTAGTQTQALLAPPNTRSANAIFITRYKLFLFRSFLLNMKRTIVSKFPRKITTVSDARAQLQAMTCASESISSMAEKELLSDEVEADIFFVIVPAVTLISRNVTVEGVRETAETFIYNCWDTKPGV